MMCKVKVRILLLRSFTYFPNFSSEWENFDFLQRRQGAPGHHLWVQVTCRNLHTCKKTQQEPMSFVSIKVGSPCPLITKFPFLVHSSWIRNLAPAGFVLASGPQSETIRFSFPRQKSFWLVTKFTHNKGTYQRRGNAGIHVRARAGILSLPLG